MRPGTTGILFALLATTPFTAARSKDYRLGVVIEPAATQSERSARQIAFDRFARALSERLQETVTLEILDSHGDETQALEAGLVDMALVKAVSYGRARNRNSGISGLVTVVSRNDNEEVTTHSGYIVTREETGIAGLDDLKGKRFGFIRNSASGLAYPGDYLERHGLRYDRDFTRVCFPSHSAMITALNAGEIDAATTYRPPHLSRNSDLAHLKVIARIENIPNPLIAVSSSLSESQRQELANALTGLPETAFQGVGFYGLKPVDETLYEPVVALDAGKVCS